MKAGIQSSPAIVGALREERPVQDEHHGDAAGDHDEQGDCELRP